MLLVLFKCVRVIGVVAFVACRVSVLLWCCVVVVCVCVRVSLWICVFVCV